MLVLARLRRRVGARVEVRSGQRAIAGRNPDARTSSGALRGRRTRRAGAAVHGRRGQCLGHQLVTTYADPPAAYVVTSW